MTKLSEKELQKKRENIQVHFWNQIGAVEHLSLPMLEDTVRREFRCKDDRFVQEQIMLMQTEKRIRLESRLKVWIRQPKTP